MELVAVSVIILGRPELEPAIRRSLAALRPVLDGGASPPPPGAGPSLVVIGCDGRRDWVPYVQRERAFGRVPATIVVGHDQPCVRCAALLRAGADAWIPETPDVLLAQQLEHNVPPLWRRASGQWQVACAGVRFEAMECLAFFEGAAVRLRPRQFLLLTYLATRPGCWISEEELREHGLGVQQRHQTALVRVHLSGLRRALGDRSGCVQSRRGLGYRFVPPSVPARSVG